MHLYRLLYIASICIYCRILHKYMSIVVVCIKLYLLLYFVVSVVTFVTQDLHTDLVVGDGVGGLYYLYARWF